ncbi:MAG: sigma-E factor negative regulatory protein [Telluria sp.]
MIDTMDTNKKIREHISALCDGELPTGDIELAFVGLRTPDGQQAWDVYHHIGDVLRSQAPAELSPGFSERLAARLAAEPMASRRRPETLADADGDAKRAVVAASRP